MAITFRGKLVQKADNATARCPADRLLKTSARQSDKGIGLCRISFILADLVVV